MFVSSKVKLGASAAALALALGTTSFSANAVLERVGPNNPAPSVASFPAWYQDTTGLALEFCAPTSQAEVDAGMCLLLPADVPVTPEVFPTNFFDEHFWYAADASMTAASGSRVLLVLAVEAAFATAVQPGDQVAFSRIRVRLDDVPLTGTYRFIHPYGEEVINGVAGDRIFATDDMGIGSPGVFTGALDSRLGPFLLPSNAPGGAELPPYANPAVPGKLYIADPARLGAVTGSKATNPATPELPPGMFYPRASTDITATNGAARSQNVFRVEGPAGSNIGGVGIDFIETTNFSLIGRIFTGAIPGRVDVSRASYARKAAGQRLDVFATASRTTQGRIPPQPRPVPVWPLLSFFDAPCTSALDADGFPVAPFSAPASASETNMASTEGIYWGQAVLTAIPSAVCIKDGNAADANGTIVPAYIPRSVADVVMVDQASYHPIAQTLTVRARSSDEIAPPVLKLAYGTFLGDLANGGIVVPNVTAPPDKVRVISSNSGVKEDQVLVSTDPPNRPPVAVADTASTVQGVPVTIQVLANDSDLDLNPLSVIAVSAVTPATAGTVTFGASNVTFSPAFLFHGAAGFTYTISDGQGGSATAPVSVTVTLGQNLPPVANADIATTAFGTPVTIAVRANDTDANGDTLSVVAVTNGAKGTVVNTGTNVTYTPNPGQSGGDTFTYTVADGRGGQASASVTVTIGPAPTIAFTRSDFLASTSEWRLAGNNSTIGATVTVRLGPLTGPVIGTAVVTPLRTWSLVRRNSAVVPGALDTISVRSTNGAELVGRAINRLP